MTRPLALFLASVFGVAVMLLITRNGIGILPFDSIIYINTSWNVLTGHGFYENNYYDFGRSAMTHYAPLYSAAIALISASGIEPLSAARLLNSLLFGANILCIGIAIRVISSSWKAALTGAICAMMSESMLHIHCLALSEPLFLLLFLLSVILLSQYIASQKTIALVLSSLMLSCSVCTRYSGAALIAAEIVAVLLLCRTTVKQRCIDAASVAVIGSAPIGLWTIRNLLISGNPFDRFFSFCPIAPRELKQGLHTIAQWVFPGQRLPLVTIPLLSVCLLALAVLLLRPLGTAPAGAAYLLRKAVRLAAPDSMSRIFLLFVVVYLLFLVLSMSTFDHQTPFDMRILLPVFVSCLILGIAFCANAFSRQWNSRAARALFFLCILIVGFSYVLTGVRWVTKEKNQHAYIFLKPGKTSGIISAVKDLPPGTMLYSNNECILWLYCDRPACMLPWYLTAQEKSELGADSPEVEKEMAVHRAAMKNFLDERRAAVVWLDSALYMINKETLPRDSILACYRLSPILRCADGTLYGPAQ